jgi:hypothetical protein
MGRQQRESAMDRRTVVVETGLDEQAEWRGTAYRRHARTRFVETARPDVPRLPEIGEGWEPLTVRARLHRMAEIFRRIPHDPDTRPAGHRSCMPTPVREVFKDQPGEPMRVPVSRADFAAARQVLESLVTLTWEQRCTAWAIANKLSDRRLGRELKTNHHAAAGAKQRLLEFLAADWNGRQWVVEEADILAATAFIHRNID